ncbi:class I SAM-dependent methyltransferase [Isoalcanivorax indicus]|uniref:class I SAM-dependent methyltransferase n=1 Tax=Isoalcanivorax indicus TaxID=2202653 RepID=UPI001FE92D11|nr:class I SAM-dependent methyltransferase [Isoalcanivorax indicus]
MTDLPVTDACQATGPARLALLPGAPAQLAGPRLPDEAAAAAYPLVLGTRDGVLALWRPQGRETPLYVDFSGGRMGYRLSAERARHERLVRAAGRLPDEGGLLVDATAGLGRDAALLAAAGWQVVMLERHPVLHALLADGLARAPLLAGRLTLVQADSCAWLAQSSEAPTVVYLDPMFPARDKSAAVKKELVWLQWLTDATPDETEEAALLAAALATASKRVVVKRPLRAAPLAGRAPSHAHSGKTVRFDVYGVLPA